MDGAADNSMDIWGSLFVGLFLLGFYLVLSMFMYGPVFRKAHQPFWASVIPIYRRYVLLRITGRSAWWLIWFGIASCGFVALDVVATLDENMPDWLGGLAFIGLFVAYAPSIMLGIRVAETFGKTDGFAIWLLWLLPFIGYPIIGYGNARYAGGGVHEARSV